MIVREGTILLFRNKLVLARIENTLCSARYSNKKLNRLELRSVSRQ